MTTHQSAYVSKPVDENGNVAYTQEENSVWRDLMVQQTPIVNQYACQEYLHGIKLLQLTENKIPQYHEITQVLKKTTGWSLEPVPALIPNDYFFQLLSERKFPAATFIRRRDELNYVKEPDIFHEIFGHCPLLTNQAYADFTHAYGKLCLKASEEERTMLARLYWFTVEFGLVNTSSGLKAYGGGILSSKNETIYCIESDTPKRLPFHAEQALLTDYRIDIMQPTYFVIDRFEQLFELTKIDLMGLIHQAMASQQH